MRLKILISSALVSAKFKIRKLNFYLSFVNSNGSAYTAGFSTDFVAFAVYL